MKKSDRKRLRILQDKLILLANKHNIPNTYCISVGCIDLKLYQLVDYIWPEYEEHIKRAIKELS